MRIGLSTYTYTWAVGVSGHDPEHPMRATDLVDRAHQLDVPVVQIADNLPLEDLSEDELERLADHARGLGVDLEVGTRGIAADRVARLLSIARVVGSPIVRVVVDRDGHEPDPDEVVARLAPHADAFRRAGVVLAIENHDRFTASKLAGVVMRLGVDWTGICLDTVNSLGALEGPGVVVETLAPLAVNLHVKDFTIVRVNEQMGFNVRGCAVGDGRLNVPKLVAHVASGSGRVDEMTAVIELWTQVQNTLEATIELEAAWAERSVRNLREVLESAA